MFIHWGLFSVVNIFPFCAFSEYLKYLCGSTGQMFIIKSNELTLTIVSRSSLVSLVHYYHNHVSKLYPKVQVRIRGRSPHLRCPQGRLNGRLANGVNQRGNREATEIVVIRTHFKVFHHVIKDLCTNMCHGTTSRKQHLHYVKHSSQLQWRAVHLLLGPSVPHYYS